MPYVLIALHREGDEATRLTLDTAQDIARKRAGAKAFFGESPPLNGVEQAAQAIHERERRGLIFGHCGRGSCNLRAQQESEPVWCKPERFGAMFSGASVYVFACETIADENDPGWSKVKSFGEIALKGGLACFVGHSIEVGVPGIPPNWNEQQATLLRESTQAAMLAFLEGEERQKHLRSAMLEGLSALDEFVASDQCPPDGETHEAKGWGAAVLLHQLRQSLFVLPVSSE